MNPVRNHPLRLLEFCFLTLFLLTHSSSACVPLLSDCRLSASCCMFPFWKCVDGACNRDNSEHYSSHEFEWMESWRDLLDRKSLRKWFADKNKNQTNVPYS
nr:PREDICTED: uncharacterized protein LOC109038157 isoform X3 [Bemisia tabaci]